MKHGAKRTDFASYLLILNKRVRQNFKLIGSVKIRLMENFIFPHNQLSNFPSDTLSANPPETVFVTIPLVNAELLAGLPELNVVGAL